MKYSNKMTRRNQMLFNYKVLKIVNLILENRLFERKFKRELLIPINQNSCVTNETSGIKVKRNLHIFVSKIMGITFEFSFGFYSKVQSIGIFYTFWSEA